MVKAFLKVFVFVYIGCGSGLHIILLYKGIGS